MKFMNYLMNYSYMNYSSTQRNCGFYSCNSEYLEYFFMSYIHRFSSIISWPWWIGMPVAFRGCLDSNTVVTGECISAGQYLQLLSGSPVPPPATGLVCACNDSLCNDHVISYLDDLPVEPEVTTASLTGKNFQLISATLVYISSSVNI